MSAIRWMALVWVLAASGAPAQLPEFAATVNGTGITHGQLQSRVESTMQQRGQGYGNIKSPEVFKDIQRDVLGQLITQELLWQEAQRRQYVATEAEVEQLFDQIESGFESEQDFLFFLQAGSFDDDSYREDLKRQISVRTMVAEDLTARIAVTDEEIDTFYSENQEQMKRPPQIRARHILIEAGPAAGEATREAALDKIEKLLVRAREGADFAALAAEHSDDSSASAGGDLGFFGRGQMVTAFEFAAFGLQPGEISDVVQTRYGYHIIKVEERRGDAIVAKSEAADRIRAHLQQQKAQASLDALVERLQAEGDVEVLLPM